MMNSIVIGDSVQAHLRIEVDGNNQDILMQNCETIMNLVEQFETGEILFADTQAQKDKLWELRRIVGKYLKSESIYKEEYTVVPRFELPKLLAGVKTIGDKYGFKSICYGHAGDGNLYINIIKGDMSDEKLNNELTEGIKEIFNLTVNIGGTFSGETILDWYKRII